MPRILDNIPASCSACALLRGCGGLAAQDAFFGCGLKCFGCDDSCQDICPSKADIRESIREVRGLDGRVPQVSAADVDGPDYIPMIHRRITGLDELEEPFVAVPTHALFRSRTGRDAGPAPVASNGEELRQWLGVPSETRIVAVSVATDRVIERYWKYRRTNDLSGALSRLDLSAVTCPNYSFFFDAVKLNTVVNRHRMICVMEEMTAQGVPVVPHLNGLDDGDWTYWERFLRENRHVSVVAKEFQTGPGEAANRSEVLRRLATLQERVDRPLRLLAVAGGHLVSDLKKVVASVCVIDSTPFMKTLKRQKRTHVGGWRKFPMRRGDSMGELLHHNIDLHRDWIVDGSDATRYVERRSESA